MPFKNPEIRRQRQREYQRKYNHSQKGIECRRKYDRKRSKNPQRAAWVTRYRKYYQKNPEYKKKKREYSNHVREIWQNGVKLEWGMGSKSAIIKESEKFAKDVALPQLGFQNITETCKMFPFDFIADLNGKVCLIDVTMTKSRDIKKKNKLASRLRLPFYVLFIRPDKSFYYLKQVKPDARAVSVPTSIILALGSAKPT